MPLDKKQKKALVDYLVDECPYSAKFSDTGRHYCDRKYDQRCNRNGNLFLDYLQCPKECQHHPDNIHVECDRHKCAILKKKLKKLEDALCNTDN